MKKETIFPFFPFFFLPYQWRPAWWQTNNRAHGSKRFAERRFTSLGLRSKNRRTPKVWTNPPSNDSSSELHIYPAAFDNYLAARFETIYMITIKASKLCNNINREEIWRERNRIVSKENLKFSRRERCFERFLFKTLLWIGEEIRGTSEKVKKKKVSQTLVKKTRTTFSVHDVLMPTPRSLKASAHYAKLPVHRSQLQPRRGL